MKSFGWVLCGLAALGFGWGLGEARAQIQDFPVIQPPGLSPYLNLFRPGSSPALNYFDIVRPQLQNQANFQALQQQQTMFRQQLYQITPNRSSQGTAKVPGYMTHGKYFGTTGTIAAGTGQTRRSLSDRRRVQNGTTQNGINQNGVTPNRTPGTGTTVPTFGTQNTGVQTRTVFGSNNLNNFNQPGSSPGYIAPYSPAFTPFNPYRGF